MWDSVLSKESDATIYRALLKMLVFDHSSYQRCCCRVNLDTSRRKRFVQIKQLPQISGVENKGLKSYFTLHKHIQKILVFRLPSNKSIHFRLPETIRANHRKMLTNKLRGP
jgi:hypothetical protein